MSNVCYINLRHCLYDASQWMQVDYVRALHVCPIFLLNQEVLQEVSEQEATKQEVASSRDKNTWVQCLLW